MIHPIREKPSPSSIVIAGDWSILKTNKNTNKNLFWTHSPKRPYDLSNYAYFYHTMPVEKRRLSAGHYANKFKTLQENFAVSKEVKKIWNSVELRTSYFEKGHEYSNFLRFICSLQRNRSLLAFRNKVRKNNLSFKLFYHFSIFFSIFLNLFRAAISFTYLIKLCNCAVRKAH